MKLKYKKNKYIFMRRPRPVNAETVRYFILDSAVIV